MSPGDDATPTTPPRGGGDEVHGQVSEVTGGQVAVGGRVFQIDAASGSHVVINAEADVEVVRRPAPVFRPPPAFPGLVARTAEIGRIRTALEAGASVEVHGPAGIGKTALLRAASNLPLPHSTPDGVVAIPARLGTADTLSYVFDTCYVGTRRVVPRREELTAGLADLRLLVVLDDTSLTRDDIDALREALPSSLLLLAGMEQRVFDGVEGIALGGLTVDEGVDLIRAGLGRELTERERDVGARVSEVLHGTPLELVRFASLVRADEWDLVSVARGFGVDAQPEDLLVAVRRSVSVEEQAVLSALAAFDAPVGAGPVAAFSGRTDAGALLLHLCERGLVHGDDLQGWRVRERTAAPPEDRQRAATVLATWVRGRGAKEVAGEIPAIARALEQARQDHRWVDAIALAAAAEQPLALAGRWSAWKDTLEAGRAAALSAGDMTSKRFFDHQLGVIDDAMTTVIPVVGPDSGPHPETPPPDDGSHPPDTGPTPSPPGPRWGRVLAAAAALLVLIGLAVGAAVLFSGDGSVDDEAPVAVVTSAAPTTAGPTTAPPPAGAPNLVTFTLKSEDAVLRVDEDKTFTVRVQNKKGTGVTASTGGVLTVSFSGDEAVVVAGTPGCTVDSGVLRCDLRGLPVGRTTDVTVTLRGRAAGSVKLATVAQAAGHDPGPTTKRTFTVSPGPCTVPDVVGMQEEEARALLQGEQLNSVSTYVEAGVTPGTVVAVDPGQGQTVDCGSTVTLSVSAVT